MEGVSTKHLTELRQRFQALRPRDQLALKVLMGFLGLSLVIFAIVLPAKDFHKQSLEQFVQERELFNWLQAQELLVEKTSIVPDQPKRNSGQSLLTHITESAKKHNLSVKRIQPDGEKQVRVWMEQVPFDDAIVWLEEVVQQQRVSLNEVTMERQSAVPGVVNLRATISF